MRKNAVLISIRPKWVLKIANGEKDIEVRKTAPKLDEPFKCYIYCTKHHDAYDLLELHDWDKGTIKRMNCMVVGEFVCDAIYPIRITGDAYVDHSLEVFYLLHHACLEICEAELYAKGKPLFGWHISDLKIYDEPKALSEFRKHELPTGLRYEDDIITRPPQSWCYVDGVEK